MGLSANENIFGIFFVHEICLPFFLLPILEDLVLPSFGNSGLPSTSAGAARVGIVAPGGQCFSGHFVGLLY